MVKLFLHSEWSRKTDTNFMVLFHDDENVVGAISYFLARLVLRWCVGFYSKSSSNREKASFRRRSRKGQKIVRGRSSFTKEAAPQESLVKSSHSFLRFFEPNGEQYDVKKNWRIFQLRDFQKVRHAVFVTKNIDIF